MLQLRNSKVLEIVALFRYNNQKFEGPFDATETKGRKIKA
jgi:hypothetical protein